jgi:Flp pilus assembly protein TadG
MIELALVLPILLLLVLGTGFVGRVFYHSVIVSNAARAGAGYGIRQHYSDSAGMINHAVADGSTNISGFNATNVPLATFYCKCPGEAAPACGTANSGACWNPDRTPRTCPTYGDTRIYVEVDTQYTFNSFGTGAGGSPVSVSVLGNRLPSTISLNGCAVMRAR